MNHRKQADDLDPTDQGGKPLMLIGALVGILIALAVLVGIYFLAT